MATKSLTKRVPAWHAEAKQILSSQFAAVHEAFVSATNRAVWLGLFLNYLKERGKEDGSIPHGEFGPWLGRELPDIPWRQAQRYMDLGRGVAEKGHFELADFCEFARDNKMDFLRILKAHDLSPKLLEIKETVERIVGGKTQVQLMLELKNVDAEGNPRGPGRLPGEGGRPALTLGQRADLLKRQAVVDGEALIQKLRGYGSKFVAADDTFCETLEAELDHTLKSIRAWLRQPKHQRDPHAIEELMR